MGWLSVTFKIELRNYEISPNANFVHKILSPLKRKLFLQDFGANVTFTPSNTQKSQYESDFRWRSLYLLEIAWSFKEKLLIFSTSFWSILRSFLKHCLCKNPKKLVEYQTTKSSSNDYTTFLKSLGTSVQIRFKFANLKQDEVTRVTSFFEVLWIKLQRFWSFIAKTSEILMF